MLKVVDKRRSDIYVVFVDVTFVSSKLEELKLTG